MSDTTPTPDDIAAFITLLDDVRCDLLEAQKALVGIDKQSTMQDLQVQLDNIWRVLTHPPESSAVPLLQEVLQVLVPRRTTSPWWHRWCWPGAVVLAAGLGLALGAWTMRPGADMQAWAMLGQRLDGVLVEQYL